MFSKRRVKTFFSFFLRKKILTFHANRLLRRHKETICLKCRNLFCGKNMSMLSADLAQRVVKVKYKHMIFMVSLSVCPYEIASVLR